MLTCKECGSPFLRTARSGPIPQRCPPCKAIRKREVTLASGRRYQQRHPDRAKASHAKWMANNPEKVAAGRARTAAANAANPERMRAYYWANRELYQAKWLERTYGLDAATYQGMLAEQGGVCAICEQPERHRTRDGRLKALAVDHDHETGAVRGLLCHACNAGIGYLNDDPALLEVAGAYLRRHGLQLVKAGD